MVQSAGFHHISDLPEVTFYGTPGNLQAAVVRSERDDLSSPVTSSTRLHIIRRMTVSQGWKCLTRICSGYSSRCAHSKAVQSYIDKGITHFFHNIHVLEGDQTTNYTDTDSDDQSTQDEGVPQERYTRPIIPTEAAFQLDHDVNKHARNNTSGFIQAAKSCNCGCSIDDELSSEVRKTSLRIETTRCFVTYEQEIWRCGRGHVVIPEQDADMRDGLVWLSKDTAYTEVFLFEILLHMTSNGATISCQSDLRLQILFLQTDYMSRQSSPRSTHSLRKATILYAMQVVRALPATIFRCQTCATVSEDAVYYDKLSFDGQQIGFNIRKDVRYDFYGKPATHWRRPVERNTKAWNITHLIESRSLRSVIMEALRAKEIPPSCNSVQSLCRTMMNIPLRSQETVRAAVAAIKLFDQGWSAYVPALTPLHEDATFNGFHTGNNPNLFAHPLQFITDIKTSDDFCRGDKIIRLFREVVNCERAAMMVCILINGLRADLKNHIPIHDRGFIENYAYSSYDMLNLWLSELSQQNSWTQVIPTTTQQISQETSNGIAEHAGFLDHPFRAPFSWTHIGNNSTRNTWEKRMMSCVRRVGPWICPDDAQLVVLLLMMALLTESTSVWIRDGELKEILAAQEVLQNAETYCSQPDAQYHYRAALQSTFPISILYEGVLSILGADTSLAIPVFQSMKEVLQLIPDRFDAYSILMINSFTTKPFMASPKEFDDMLILTGAFRGNRADNQPGDNGEHINHLGNTAAIREMYQKMADSRTNDFMETGIWGPDFPIRRPSPSASFWGSDTSHAEVSCSKDFNTHSAFSPGTFGGYCVCKHAKTVLISFLKRPEGCRMPLNIIVERCARLPRYVIYDFACGTQRAAAGISVEITKNTSFIIDPFHFPGHKTCSLAMHESNYADLRGCNFESQEQRNSGIKLMERSLRASKDVHFMHFVILAHAYRNLKALFRDYLEDCTDIENWEASCGGRAWLKWARDTYLSP